MPTKQEQLDEIRTRAIAADLPLKETATNIVFGKGNPDAPILFIGEAPGEKEDLQGMPFVGAAGKQLDKLLHSIGLTLDGVYIANILKYRPPNNRNPNPDEIRTHTPFLIEQIEVIKPTVVATLGNYATKFILSGCEPDKMETIAGIAVLHGEPKEMQFKHHMFLVIPLYHPAAMLYKPALRMVMEEDFKKMGEVIGVHLGKGENSVPGSEKAKTLSEFF